jgi:hypothetical protein
MMALHATKALAATLAAAALTLAGAMPAQAALVDRGGGLVYDTANDITWLAAPALLPGPVDWTPAVLFASSFVHAGGSDWRLPRSSFIDAGCALGEGFDCSDSEMARLFYQQLGGQADSSVFDGSGDTPEEQAAVALFPALAESWFWSGQAADDGSNTAFAFHFANGLQLIRDTGNSHRVLLVHDGDIGAMTVDATPTLPLVLASIALMVVAPIAAGRRPVLSGPLAWRLAPTGSASD